MKTIKHYQFRLFLIRFFIIGMMAYIVEGVFTGTVNLIKSLYDVITVPNYFFDISTATEGHTGLLAFFVYCWAAIPFTILTNPLKSLIRDKILIPKLGVVLRGIIYGLIFMAIEFIIGIILLYVFSIRGWDYRHLPLNVLGVITFAYLPAWTIAGIIGEWFHDRLLQIDDILLNPGGYNDEGSQRGFKKYKVSVKKK